MTNVASTSCYRCKATLPLVAFGLNRSRRDGHSKRCFQCNSAAMRAARARGLAKTHKSSARTLANKAVAQALRRGRLVRATQCQYCGCRDVPLEAHHYLGYAPEHRLSVLWTCRSCHKICHTQGSV